MDEVFTPKSLAKLAEILRDECGLDYADTSDELIAAAVSTLRFTCCKMLRHELLNN